MLNMTLSMDEEMNLEDLCLYVKGQAKEVVKKYMPLNSKSLKKSPSVWSFRDYTCEACSKTFTQCHTSHA